MEMPFRMRLPIRGTLVKSHRIRERNLEDVVVARRRAPQNICQQLALLPGQFVDRREMPLAQQQGLKRPHRPERHHHGKCIVLADDPLLPFDFNRQIIA